jgi:hypothetical protein
LARYWQVAKLEKKSTMLKKLLFVTLISFSAFTAQSQEKPAAIAAPAPAVAPVSNAEILFDKELHDYGTIEQGANGEYEFKFKNTGKDPLVISNCQGSCGCTVPKWPKEPILPGATSSIKVTYDTKRIGAFTKDVTITSNAKTNPKKIQIKGIVNAKPEDETFPAKKAGFGVPLETK